MGSDVVISVDSVSKKYCKSLKHSMFYGLSDIGRNLCGLRSPSASLRPFEFWAVDNTSFEIKRGESFGLIGPNGSGKTTLLKMLNGIFWPDKGKISINGRVSALIAVGAGFHPMLSGRDNIYINGAILGMNKKEVDREFDSIVDFADIGDFLDTPVKNYSSGMYVRLGFAIAVHCRPEILLVDEVLAVGDRDFQIKCYQKINEIKKQAATIVLVAHNEYTIREYTTRCLYLSDGRQRFLGSSEDGISCYLKDILEHRSHATPVNAVEQRANYRKAELLPVKFLDRHGHDVTFLRSGDELNIVLDCVVHETLTRPIFGVNFYDNAGFMYCANSYYENHEFAAAGRGRVRVTIQIPECHLPSNNYLCTAFIADDNPDNLQDWHNMAYKLVVGRAQNARGSIRLPVNWRIQTDHEEGR